jgi:hypothetical protein
MDVKDLHRSFRRLLIDDLWKARAKRERKEEREKKEEK